MQYGEGASEKKIVHSAKKLAVFSALQKSRPADVKVLFFDGFFCDIKFV